MRLKGRSEESPSDFSLKHLRAFGEVIMRSTSGIVHLNF
jgi:hypothetical protein